MNYDRTIPNETIAEMVQRIEPAWTVREATPATDGHHAVYHLDVATEAGRRQCVLKATPPEKSPTCGGEARLLAVLGAHTSMPVPEVFGVVDDHERLPAPFFLSSALPGANYSRTKLTELSEAHVEQLALSTGRHLAALHDLDAVDAYGFVEVDADGTLDGSRPGDDIERIGVQDPVDSWTEYLAAEVDRAVAGLDATRFEDLAPAARSALESRVDGLSGEFDPVVARIDQSLDNVLLDPETGAVTGVIDWEFCVAATRAYDLAFVERSLAGGHWRLLPGAPDHQATIRAAMLDGYRDAGSDRAVEQFRENYDCYALLATHHSMLNFEDWFDQVDAIDGTEEEREAAAAALRARAEEMVADGAD